MKDLTKCHYSFQVIVDTKASKTEIIAMQDILQDEINARASDTDFQGLKVSLKDTLEYLFQLLFVCNVWIMSVR